MINVNIPRLSRGAPKGLAVVPQATGGFHEYYIPQKNGASETVFQLAGGDHRPEENPTDTTTLSEQYITVTPLRADMTDHEKTRAFKSRLDRLRP